MKQILDFNISNSLLNISFEGDYLLFSNDNAKGKVFALIKNNLQGIVLSAQALGKWDSTLLSFIFEIEKRARELSIPVRYNAFPDGLINLINLAFSVDRKPSPVDTGKAGLLESIGSWGVSVYHGIKSGLSFMGKTFNAVFRSMFGRVVMRSLDFAAVLEECGYKALPIVSLISFMVGLILAFVGAVQLKTFGAQIYVASLVTIGMTRIMGAIMTGIIMAGRTGASDAAVLGTMQVNEELDALKTMGINQFDFLVLPRIIALSIAMPILTMWADFMGMLGGGFVGVVMLDIPLQKYWEMSVAAITLNNFFVGIFHGLIFGIVIAVCGCYYGISCGRNADAVGTSTTKAVVSAIVWMIVMTGFITLACEVLDI